jgi:hypothetical protein
MSEATYTVFDMEVDAGDSDVSGLSVEEAARELIRRADYWHETRRVDGVMTLVLHDTRKDPYVPAPEAPVITSALADDAAAVTEIYAKVIGGDPPLRGSWTAVPDDRYERPDPDDI